MSLDPKRDAKKSSESEQEQLEFVPLAKRSSQERLSLRPLDWACLVTLVIAIIVAPIIASTFSTPPRGLSNLPDDLEALLKAVGNPLLSILVSIALGMLLWREWKKPVAIGLIPGLSGAFALLAVWCVASAIPGNGTWLSLNALMSLLTGLLAGGMVSRLGRNSQALALLAFAVIFSGSIASAYGVNEYLIWRNTNPGYRTSGTFLNENFLAGYLAMTLPLTFAVFISSKQRLIQFFVGTGLALQSGCLLLTGSRAGVGVGIVAILLLLALSFLTGLLKGRALATGLGIAICLAGATLGRTPSVSRVAASDASGAKNSNVVTAIKSTGEAQSHSWEFRKSNWIGTVKMTTRNPILGTGIGTYSIAYPRYADTAFTFHAHNGFLQLAGETGLPGILLVLTGIAALTAFALHAVIRGDSNEGGDTDSEVPDEFPTKPQKNPILSLESPKLALCGLLISIAALLMHSLFDSDWYIGSTLFGLSAVFGLTAAAARHLSPLATQAPKVLGKEFSLIGLALIVFLVWRGNAVIQSRINLMTSSNPISVDAAISTAKTAAAADPFDPEPHLLLSQLYRNSPEESLAELKKATELSPSGRTFYLLGKYYFAKGQWDDSEKAFEKSRFYDPHNLQTLKALAECFHSAGKLTEAREIFQTMEFLETGIYGKVRAIPELQEMEFVYAHSGIGNIAFEQSNWKEAESEYAVALKQLGSYWPGRNSYYNSIHSKEKKAAFKQLYLEVLKQAEETNKKTGKPELNPELERMYDTVNSSTEE